MKAIMLMFDSLNRHMLPSYGCEWVHAPNFQRLATRTAVFDNCYAGSLPCMPARRELHTGRYNFLHASWGPIEPFDDSMPEILKDAGTYTHLITDHYHYFEDGGATYHTRFASWELARGQEGDPWKGVAGDFPIPENLNDHDGLWGRQDWVNRSYICAEEDFPQAQTMRLGMEFIRRNAKADNWFLQLETFDPHEPYYAPQRYKDLYPHDYKGPILDWPPYGRGNLTEEQARHLVSEYAALLSMCDEYLGRVLDLMDELDLWKDTMLIVNTDHGFLLGEHGWWAKMVQPFYNEVARTPLFIWDPRSGVQNERREALVQTIDLPATLLEFFGQPLPPAMQGRPLAQTVIDDAPVREAALFGMFGASVNVTDGKAVYMRAPAGAENKPLFEYTLMPTEHGSGRAMIGVDRLAQAELAMPLPFTKGAKVLRLPSTGESGYRYHAYGTLLFDLEHDPRQEQPVTDPALEQQMIKYLVRLMRESDSPPEQFERLGL